MRWRGNKKKEALRPETSRGSYVTPLRKKKGKGGRKDHSSLNIEGGGVSRSSSIKREEVERGNNLLRLRKEEAKGGFRPNKKKQERGKGRYVFLTVRLRQEKRFGGKRKEKEKHTALELGERREGINQARKEGKGMRSNFQGNEDSEPPLM